jgi:hypothetical protein
MPHKNSPRFQAFNHHTNISSELAKLNQQRQIHLEHQKDLAKQLLATTATPILPPLVSTSVKQQNKSTQMKTRSVKATASVSVKKKTPVVKSKVLAKSSVKSKTKAKVATSKVTKKRVPTLKAKTSKTVSAKTVVKRKAVGKTRAIAKVSKVKSR